MFIFISVILKKIIMANANNEEFQESVKRVKYDRQLRLWDDHGQFALEEAHICLINATATGTEILKSLVLPGVGSFTILDGAKVTGQDAGSNFFLSKDSIGKFRAKVATENILELNPDVRGEYVVDTVDCILESEKNFFRKFTVVIACSLEEKCLLQLSEKLWILGIPLVICVSYGTIGYLRLQFSDRTIIESRPESEFHDLRLDQPFPSLKEYIDSIDLTKVTDQEHGHIPYVVILSKYLDEWRKLNGEIPKNSKEKQLFKNEILKGMRKKDEEENFLEAVRAVNASLSKTIVPSQIMNILNNPLCDHLTSESKPFWILARALKEFINSEGELKLPVRGVIPDMTSDTQNYIKLQNIYKDKAMQDACVIHHKVQALLNKLERCPNSISEQEVKVFCKNAHCLRVLQGRSLKDEYDVKTSNIQELVENLGHDDSDILFYVLIRTVNKFYSQYNRLPGRSEEELQSDLPKLKGTFSKLLQEWGCTAVMKDDYVQEICRLSGAELHSVAAFMGGTAAFEVIKLITGQYVPLNNTLVYYAVTQTTSVFCL